MVVDNDAAVITLVTFDLELEGHTIAGTAGDPESAVQVCAEVDPDVVIIDFKLGKGLDGIDVARQVARPGRRLIIHTNYVSPTVVKRATDVGAVVVEKGSIRALRRAVTG